MLTNTVTVLFLACTLVAAGPIAKRSVLSDLDTVASDLRTLDSDITGWNGLLLTALPLLSDVETLEDDLKTAISSANSSSAFSTSDSTSITSEVTTLESLVSATLSDLVDKVFSPGSTKLITGGSQLFVLAS
jgi:Hydrophobic surface binding protein A.